MAPLVERQLPHLVDGQLLGSVLGITRELPSTGRPGTSCQGSNFSQGPEGWARDAPRQKVVYVNWAVWRNQQHWVITRRGGLFLAVTPLMMDRASMYPDNGASTVYRPLTSASTGRG